MQAVYSSLDAGIFSVGNPFLEDVSHGLDNSNESLACLRNDTMIFV